MKNIIIRICKWLLPLFGVSAVSCDEGGFQPSDEYGTPHADFEIKGRVLESSRSRPFYFSRVVFSIEDHADNG